MLAWADQSELETLPQVVIGHHVTESIPQNLLFYELIRYKFDSNFPYVFSVEKIDDVMIVLPV